MLQKEHQAIDILLAEIDIYELFAFKHCKGRKVKLALCEGNLVLCGSKFGLLVLFNFSFHFPFFIFFGFVLWGGNLVNLLKRDLLRCLWRRTLFSFFFNAILIFLCRDKRYNHALFWYLWYITFGNEKGLFFFLLWFSKHYLISFSMQCFCFMNIIIRVWHVWFLAKVFAWNVACGSYIF